MPFTLTGDVFMFCCYNIYIYNGNCPTKEQAFGFLVNCFLYVGLFWGSGFEGFFFPFCFSFVSINIYIELLNL